MRREWPMSDTHLHAITAAVSRNAAMRPWFTVIGQTHAGLSMQMLQRCSLYYCAAAALPLTANA